MGSPQHLSIPSVGLHGRPCHRLVLLTGLVIGLLQGCSTEADSQQATMTGADQQHQATPTQPVASVEHVLGGDLADHFKLIQQGQSDAARLRLRRYLDQHPDDGHAHFLFGLTYHVEKRYEPALDSFEQARVLVPTYGQTGYFQAWALYSLGRASEAADALAWFLAADENHADGIFLQGLLAYDSGDLETAAAHFQRSAELFEASPKQSRREIGKAYIRLADVRIQQSQWDDAHALLVKASAYVPDVPELHFKLAHVLTRQGRLEEAAEERAAFETLWKLKNPRTSFPE